MATEQTSVSPCCVSGHVHEGTAQGSFTKLHDLNTYVVNPKDKSSTDKLNTVVVLPDIFGPYLINVQLVADEWASKGYRVVIPDVLNNDYISGEHLNAIVPNLRYQAEATILSKAADSATMAAQLGPWLAKHREAVTKPVVDKFIGAVKADSTTDKVIALGFCWGGRYAILAANEDAPAKVDVVVAFHPSFVAAADLEKISSVPLIILWGDKDSILDGKSLDDFEKDLKPRLGDKLSVKRYENAVHGFGNRGDTSDPKEKEHKETGHKDALVFVDKWM